jgi:hypothetical protein
LKQFQLLHGNLRSLGKSIMSKYLSWMLGVVAIVLLSIPSSAEAG